MSFNLRPHNSICKVGLLCLIGEINIKSEGLEADKKQPCMWNLPPPQWQVFVLFDTTEWSGSIATSTLWMLECIFSRRFWPNWLSTLFTHSKSRSFIFTLGLLCLLMGGTPPSSELPYLWYLNIFVWLPCQRPHIFAFPFIVYHTGTSDLDTSVQSALAAQMKG